MMSKMNWEITTYTTWSREEQFSGWKHETPWTNIFYMARFAPPLFNLVIAIEERNSEQLQFYPYIAIR